MTSRKDGTVRSLLSALKPGPVALLMFVTFLLLFFQAFYESFSWLDPLTSALLQPIFLFLDFVINPIGNAVPAFQISGLGPAIIFLYFYLLALGIEQLLVRTTTAVKEGS